MKQIGSDSSKQEVVGLLVSISKKLNKIERRSIKDLTGSQFLVLPLIAAFDYPPSLKDIAQKNETSHQNIRSLLNKLEEKKYVRIFADQRDYRISRVALTSEGNLAVTEYCEKREEALESLYRGISEEEIEAAHRVIAILFDRLEEIRP